VTVDHPLAPQAKAEGIKLANELVDRLHTIQDRLSTGHEQPNAEQAVSWCQRDGFTLLGLGCHRAVVDVGDEQVAKLGWRPRGLADNLIEWRLWQEANAELRHLLCPALGLTGAGILIQARCVPMHADARRDARQVSAALHQHGISDANVNLGLFEQRTVSYDYALVRPGMGRRLLGSAPEPALWAFGEASADPT
jgi:hypothetical protein